MTKTFSIAAIPGDGIGPEVIREGKKALEAVGEVYGLQFRWRDFPFSADYYLDTGRLITDSDLDELAKHDAIYLGALGDPRVSERVLLGQGVLRVRFHFDQYVNLRPVKLLRGVETPLARKTPEDIDFYVVRENTEDFYVQMGGRVTGTGGGRLRMARRLYEADFDLQVSVKPEQELAYQIGVVSAQGAERVIRYAFELARTKGLKRVTSVDKQNAVPDLYGLWREVLDRVAKEYPEIEYESAYVDAITMWFIRRPEWYQVVVAPNLFGDIITDLAAAIQGGMGLAAGGNINPEGGLSMFEPIHGSAPKYRGKNVSNPVASALAGKMMLEHLGEPQAAAALEAAAEDVLVAGRVRTYDLGGNSTCSAMGDAIAEKIVARGRRA